MRPAGSPAAPSPDLRRGGAGPGEYRGKVMSCFDAVILAGGAARRLDGVDKPALTVGARSLLERVLAACAEAERVIVVGPRRPVRAGNGPRPVWAREEPPGAGPAAALHAGLRHVRAPLVAVLAADLPFLDRATLRRLRELPPQAQGALLRDESGHDQPLTAVYRTEPLRRELALLAVEHGTLSGLPLRLLLPGLDLRRIPATGPLDCDTWADISAARTRIREHEHVLEEWIAAVKAELGIDPEVDTKTLLDAAREAAHTVARPAAPLTTFLVGYAVALHDMAPAEAARRVAALAGRWGAEHQATGTSGPAGEPGQAGTERERQP